jgi:hypothetical protein
MGQIGPSIMGQIGPRLRLMVSRKGRRDWLRSKTAIRQRAGRLDCAIKQQILSVNEGVCYPLNRLAFRS